MPKLSKKIVTLSALALLVTVCIVTWQSAGWKGTKSTSESTPVEDPRPTVVASLYPLSYFVQRITGDTLKVVLVTPPGVEPHEYEPSPQDIVQISKSNLLVLNGGGIEPWADGVQAQQTLVAGEGFVMGEVELDPHIWLDPVLAAKQVERISIQLVELFPEHASEYQTRTQVLLTELHELDAVFSTNLTGCRQSSLITAHPAFGYLARRYGFVQETIEGISSEEDPSPQRLAELVQLTREQNIEYIVYESPLSQHVAQTLAEEAGVQLLHLDPLEQVSLETQAEGGNYLAIQKVNAAVLAQALDCKHETHE